MGCWRRAWVVASTWNLKLQPNQLRQYIDAVTIFLELLHVRKEKVPTRGTMFWREISGKIYLIRESIGGSQKSLGTQDAETDRIFQNFHSKKSALSDRLKSLTNAALVQQRLNKALRVGR